MRETITIFICAVIFIVALQTGLVRTGLDYETLKNANQNLKTTNDRLTEEVEKIKNGSSQDAVLEQNDQAVKEALQSLEQSLMSNVEKGEVELFLRKGQPVVKLYESTLFDGKNTVLSEEGKKILLKMVGIFSKFPDEQVQITTYTNTGKIMPPWSTWARSHRWLGALQGAVVADWLQQEAGVDPARLMTATYGYARPSVKNNSASNRRKNQFLEVTLVATDLQALEQAREILNNEKLPPLSTNAVVAPPTINKKSKRSAQPAVTSAPEVTEEEAIGEEALDKLDENEFDAGYELPDQAQ